MIYTLTPGEVAIVGAELVGGSVAAKNLSLCLNAVSEFIGKPHKVTLVVFRNDDRPAGQLANCALDSGAVTINLMKTFCESYDKTSQTAPEISLTALFWHNTYVSYIHEALHLEDPAATEEDISVMAKELTYEIARDFGLEPPKSCAFLSAQIEELTRGVDDEYPCTQKAMFDNGWLYWSKTKPSLGELILKTFRSYMHLMSGAEEDDYRWIGQIKRPTVVVKNEHELTRHINKIDDAYDNEDATAEVVAAAIDRANMFLAGSGATKEEMATVTVEDKLLLQQFLTNSPAATHAAAAPMAVSTGYNGGFDADDYEGEASMSEEFSDDGDEFGEFTEFSDDDEAPAMNMTAFAAMAMTGVVPQMPRYNNQPTTLVTNIDPAQHSAVKVTLPKTGLSAEETSDIARGVYTKCFNHVFNVCTQNVHAVETLLPLTVLEKQVVVSMNYFDNGKWVKISTGNGLRGYISSKELLPSYKVYINVDGIEICRRVFPQNPNKRNDQGQYTKPAILARGGAKIMYVMEGSDDAKAAGAKQYICKAMINPGEAFDGNWIAC
jgi:hypothetical protein